MSTGGGKWSDGTTDDSLSEITATSKVTCAKGNPVNTDASIHFGGWQCDDTSVVIKQDGTIVTDHACTVYPKWITSYVVRWMDNDV